MRKRSLFHVWTALSLAPTAAQADTLPADSIEPFREAPQPAPVVKIGVYVNTHWRGYSWLRLRDDGKPCAQIADWLEWGIAPGAQFAPDNGSGSSLYCVMPAKRQNAPGDTPASAGENKDEAPARLRYDARRHRLAVRIDSSLMNPAQGYVPPSRLDDGIPALWLDYQVNAAQNNGAMYADVERRTTLYGTFNLGANAGPWRIRSSHLYSRNTIGKPEWEHIDAYAQRDIARWHGRLRLGEGYTDDLLFDSMPFTGAQLASEDALLPDYLQPFTPVVRGVARGNAEVLVRQRGVLFYHTVVPPGPFALTDVRPPSSSGDITVTVREADGTEHISVVPYTPMPLIVHSKVWKYAFTVGRYRRVQGSEFAQPEFAQATAGYGLPYKLSVFGGMLSARGYQSVSGGMGWRSSAAGAISVDITRSRVKQTVAQPAGNRIRMRYAKAIAATGTGIRIEANRYIGGTFRTLANVLKRDQDLAFWRELFGDEAANWVTESVPRSQLNLDVRQNFGDTGSVYANLTSYRYASANLNRVSAQVGATWYGSHFDVDVQAGINRTRGRKNVSFEVSLSIPLVSSRRMGMLRYGTTASRDDGIFVWNNRLSGSALRDYRLNYTLSEQRSTNVGMEGNARASYLSDAGLVSAGYSQGREYRKVDLSAAGSVVAYRGGVVLGQSLADTVAIVDAPGYPYASIDGQLSTRTDARGRAVIPYLTPHRTNRIGLDSFELDNQLDYNSLVREVAPSSGAVIYVPIRPERMLP